MRSQKAHTALWFYAVKPQALLFKKYQEDLLLNSSILIS